MAEPANFSADSVEPANSGPDGMTEGKKKLFVKTYGCQMNVYDSERMVAALGANGYEPTEVAEEADLILLNTCHIREKAAEKVYSDLGRLRPLKAAKPELRVGVTGCVAQAEGAEILRRAPMVDLVVGPQAYHRLPAMLERGARATPERVLVLTSSQQALQLLAGMLLEIKGEFPALHEKVTYHNYEFEVLEMDSRRILKVKFTILPKEMDESESKE